MRKEDELLYKKMEKKFEYDYEMPLLEERKKKLEAARSLKKPVLLSDIVDHGKNYDQIKK